MSSQVLLFRLCIDYVLDTIPDIIYLSGRTPFTLSIDIARPRGHARQHPEAHSSFIDVAINESVSMYPMLCRQDSCPWWNLKAIILRHGREIASDETYQKTSSMNNSGLT